MESFIVMVIIFGITGSLMFLVMILGALSHR